ncbi:MAG: LLM class flavin-dependent oxidoreductase [Betaproteobacteria bacterium]|nr:LLM class flavin-dependent oxidoreductase [Betaproteobacteria bacterium]
MRFGVGIFGNQPVTTIVRQVQLAEALGYDTAWIVDSQLVCRELYVTLTACVLATSRIRIGPGITVPYIRHPSVTASAIVSLNELAEGRVLLGVGTGDSSVGTLGVKPARIAGLEEFVRTTRRLLANESVTFEGGLEGKIAWLERAHDIPIYVAASGPKMLEAAGRLGDGVLMHCGIAPPILEAGLAYVRAGARAAEKSIEDLDVICWAHTCVARDRRAAREHVRGRVTAALRHPLPIPLGEEDLAVVRKIREEYNFFEHATAAAKHRTLAPDRFIDLLALAGTPDEVAETVRAIARVQGIGHIVITPQVPGDGFPEREEIFRLFAEEVMSRIA